MITDAIFKALAAPFAVLFGIFPDVSLPSWLCSTTTGDTCLPAKSAGFAQYLATGDRFLPLSEAFTLIEVYLGIVLGVLAFKVVVFIWTLLRG